MNMFRIIALAVAGVVAVGFPGHAPRAQLLSSNPITVVVPYAPGFAADITQRLLNQKVTEMTGQPFVVKNLAGGGGVIGALDVKRAAPDGHTLLQLVVGTHATSQRVAASPPYELRKDFEPITLLWNLPQFMAVPYASPARSVAELIAMGRSKPGGLSFASVGVNSAGHFLGELLSKETKVTMVHVPYPGAAKAVTDLITNRVDFFFSSYGSIRPSVLDNKLRTIAVASSKRLGILSNVPTMAEQGFPAATMTSQFGLAAPARTPEPVIQRLNEAFAKAARDPDVVRKTIDDGIELAPSSPAEFSAMIEKEFEKLDMLLKPSAAARK